LEVAPVSDDDDYTDFQTAQYLEEHADELFNAVYADDRLNIGVDDYKESLKISKKEVERKKLKKAKKEKKED